MKAQRVGKGIFDGFATISPDSQPVALTWVSSMLQPPYGWDIALQISQPHTHAVDRGGCEGRVRRVTKNQSGVTSDTELQPHCVRSRVPHVCEPGRISLSQQAMSRSQTIIAARRQVRHLAAADVRCRFTMPARGAMTHWCNPHMARCQFHHRSEVPGQTPCRIDVQGTACPP
jgi:hypothetical protein